MTFNSGVSSLEAILCFNPRAFGLEYRIKGYRGAASAYGRGFRSSKGTIILLATMTIMKQIQIPFALVINIGLVDMKPENGSTGTHSISFVPHVYLFPALRDMAWYTTHGLAAFPDQPSR